MTRAIVERFRAMRAGGENPAASLRLGVGVAADYDALACFHYRAGRPATIVRVLAARDERGELAGVLVVSMPTLNGAWRALAWPGVFDTPDRRENARRLNARLRTISRVVVDPRWRGLGVATRLVRAYLCGGVPGATPTLASEAPAAMGALSPFFERAGMTRYELPPARRDARLLDALAALGMDERDLAHADCLARRARADRFLARELRRWAGSSRATARHAREGPAALARRAAAGVAERRVAFAFTAGTPRA